MIRAVRFHVVGCDRRDVSAVKTDGQTNTSLPVAPETRLEFETLLANLSARFVALPPE
jgi:hypothetical protein